MRPPKTYVHMGRWNAYHKLRPICGEAKDSLMTHGTIPILTDCPACLLILRDEAFDGLPTKKEA